MEVLEDVGVVGVGLIELIGSFDGGNDKLEQRKGVHI